ncbi:MAG: tetratricopeptide repeat protein [Anaerolineales bacterium]|nr:tetratricopeptide repeat protein [Anaerolineales bacterium]
MDELNLVIAMKGTIDGARAYNQDCLRFFTDNILDSHKKSTWVPWGHSKHLVFNSFSPHIADSKLRELVDSLQSKSQKLDYLNEQGAVLLADFFDDPNPQTMQKREQERFARRIDKHRKKRGPTWKDETNCQTLIGEMDSIITEIDQLCLEIDRLMPQVYPVTYNAYGHVLNKDVDIGDQRASDLIDKADAAYSKRAIKLLQKALTYGTRGIQASKAYFGLGMRYEDMGNIELAIENYSKAIQAYKSFGMVHFWRGRLYYQQQKWIEARADFEKALSFSVENGLPSPEKEEARRYLEELSKLSQ